MTAYSAFDNPSPHPLPHPGATVTFDKQLGTRKVNGRVATRFNITETYNGDTQWLGRLRQKLDGRWWWHGADMVGGDDRKRYASVEIAQQAVVSFITTGKVAYRVGGTAGNGTIVNTGGERRGLYRWRGAIAENALQAIADDAARVFGPVPDDDQGPDVNPW